MTIVGNPDFIAEADAATAEFTGAGKLHPTHNAPTWIFVSAKKQKPMFTHMMIASAAMMAHTMVLEAADLGVGACCLWGVLAAVSNTPSLLEKLNLPIDYEPFAVIGIGHTSETFEVRDISADRIEKTLQSKWLSPAHSHFKPYDVIY